MCHHITSHIINYVVSCFNSLYYYNKYKFFIVCKVIINIIFIAFFKREKKNIKKISHENHHSIHRVIRCDVMRFIQKKNHELFLKFHRKYTYHDTI